MPARVCRMSGIFFAAGAVNLPQPKPSRNYAQNVDFLRIVPRIFLLPIFLFLICLLPSRNCAQKSVLRIVIATTFCMIIFSDFYFIFYRRFQSLVPFSPLLDILETIGFLKSALSPLLVRVCGNALYQ